MSSAVVAQILEHASLDSYSRGELLSLSRETDAELLGEGLLQWASRQEQAEHLENASLVYGILSGRAGSATSSYINVAEGLRTRAGQRLDAVLGRGSVGPRAEFLTRRLAREATNPVMLLGMGVGSAVFSGGRAAILSGLLSRPAAGIFSRGLGARALASAGAFALEVPAFWGTTKGLNEWLHPGVQSWDAATNLREMAGLGITLGALKLAGRGTSSLVPRNAPAQQAGMLGGILLGHRLEEAVGFRRPVDGATTLTDSLAMLLQFHVGGRLSQAVFGTRFQRWNAELDGRSRAMSERIPSHFSDIGGPGNWVPALAGGHAPLRSPNLEARRPFFSRPQDFIVQMSGERKNTPAVGLPVLGVSESSGPPLPPARERGIRIDVEPELPERSGRTPDDLFAAPLRPNEILARLRGQAILPELISRIEVAPEDYENLSEEDFGRALGEGLAHVLARIGGDAGYAQLRHFAEGPLLEVNFSRVPEFRQLSGELQAAFNEVAALMQISQYAIRANQSEMLAGIRGELIPEHQARYQDMLQVIRVLKGPRLLLPPEDIAREPEVLDRDLAVLSHGAGAMVALLRMISRQSMPGGRPWYARYFATEADPRAIDGIQRLGRNPLLPKTTVHNFEGDPLIEVVHIRHPLAQILYRTVRYQVLNVPSGALDRIYSEDNIRRFPERGVHISAIGGMPESKGELPQYQHEFIRGRFRRFGRDDLEIVSTPGFIPADKVWNGELVKMNFSTREDEASPGNPGQAAFDAARLFAGEYLRNVFIIASVSHWERSNNVGKVGKNIFTLMMGRDAGRIAIEVAKQQEALALGDPTYPERLQQGRGRYAEARSKIKGMMQGLLINNEGIRSSRASYNPEVEIDFENCSEINFDNLVEAVRLARILDVRKDSPEVFREYLRDFIFEAPRSRRVASTRNPRYGIMLSLYKMWSEMGLSYPLSDIEYKTTVEGVVSLDPFIRYYADSRRDIETRRLPDAVYELAEMVHGRRIEIPPLIPEFVRWAIERQPERPEARDLQQILREFGVNSARIRQAIEGRDERSVGYMSREIQRLALFYEKLTRARSRGQGEISLHEGNMQRQIEFLRQLKEASLRGNIVSALRIPIPIGPYENAFAITRVPREGGNPTHQVFIRLNLDEATQRLTHLGMLLRRFPPEDTLEIDVRIPEGARNPDNFGRILEMELTAREIVRAFQPQRPGAIRMSIDRRSVETEGEAKRDSPSDAFYHSLEPMARWVLGR